MQVSVAFQGGGARVVELMAAAAACRQVESANADFDVSRVSGASAGAIAAAAFATGMDISKAVSSISRLQGFVTARFPENRLKKRHALPRLAMGNSLYDEGDLRTLIVKLFELGGVDAEQSIRDLTRKDLQLRILRSDIRFNKLVTATEQSEARLADALVDSAAIPFAFRVPKKGSRRPEILDGGLFQNLPARAAMESLEPDQVALGFTFPSETAPDLQEASLKTYAGAIIGSLLNERVGDAILYLKQRNVIEIPNRRTTFDFGSIFRDGMQAAFSEDVASTRLKVERWVTATKLRDGPDWFSDHPQDLLEQSRRTDRDVIRFFETAANKAYRAELVHHEVVYQSHNEGMPDIYQLHIRLLGDRNPGLQFIRSFFYHSDQGSPKRAKLEVLDANGVQREAMMLPIRHPGKERVRSTLVCLDRPLAPGDDITITKTEESFLGMVEYQEKGYVYETLALGPGKSADEFRVTVHFPVAMRPKHYRDASSDFANEATDLADESGLHIPTTSSIKRNARTGCCTVISTATLKEPGSERRFVKVVYYKA